MDLEIIEKYGDPGELIGLTQIQEKLFELGAIDGFIKYLVILQAIII